MHLETRDLSTGSDYHVGASDFTTPNIQQAGPLLTNISNPRWGDTPLSYVQWFNGLWQKGDPSGWGPDVFTSNAVMLDAAGTSVGANPAASDFLLLFKYFPDLRGEVVSWAANDTEVMINWRFVITKQKLCPVIDKFSFSGGLVSFRQAYFDTGMLLGYLAENYGSGALVDYFVDRFVSSERGGSGALFAPGLFWAFFKGLFLWSDIPPSPPRGFTAVQDGRGVHLKWQPSNGALFYRVTRSTNPAGPFSWIAQIPGTSHLDRDVVRGRRYFYRVSAHATLAPMQTLPPAPSPGTKLSV